MAGRNTLGDSISSFGGWCFALLLLVVVCGGLYRGCVWLGGIYLDDVRKTQTTEIK